MADERETSIGDDGLPTDPAKRRAAVLAQFDHDWAQLAALALDETGGRDMDDCNVTDQADLEQHILKRSAALQLTWIGAMEANIGKDAHRRAIAKQAASELLARVLLSEIQENPAAVESANFILDTIRQAVMATVVVPGEMKH